MNAYASLAEELMAHLQSGGALQQMADQLGTSPEQASKIRPRLTTPPSLRSTACPCSSSPQ